MKVLFIRYGAIALAAIPAGIGHYFLLSYGMPPWVAFLFSVPVCLLLGLGFPALIRRKKSSVSVIEVTVVKNQSVSLNAPFFQPSTVAASVAAVVFVAASAPTPKTLPLVADSCNAEVYRVEVTAV